MNHKAACLSILIFCGAIRGFAGDVSENYSFIWRRNVFSTVTPPVAEEIKTAPANAPVAVKLTGIANFAPQKWVGLQIQEAGKAAVSVVVEEGGHVGPIEIVRADVASGRVWIRNNGVASVLGFGNSNARLASAENLHVPVPQVPPANAGER